jgi:hypothetical protein
MRSIDSPDKKDTYIVKAIRNGNLPFDGKPCRVERFGGEWICDHCAFQVQVSKQTLGCDSTVAQPLFRKRRELP